MSIAVKIAHLSELTPNVMKSTRIGHHTDIAVVLVDGKLYAFEDTCTHVACSISPGEAEDGMVICKCHWSRFKYETGEVVDGPAGRPIQVYPVEARGDDIYVTLPVPIST